MVPSSFRPTFFGYKRASLFVLISSNDYEKFNNVYAFMSKIRFKVELRKLCNFSLGKQGLRLSMFRFSLGKQGLRVALGLT